ncbi:linear amide C-N hydrolase [uncultured Thiodictyon sp.]|uniref:linear amide C-N hydrolase n=1 Tax=uncultured Thiodictyon sp. TaxID=1846217 RepID=UPI0025EACE44|nr:linear amide C-N hydrolase [uncultured Thiodictyon sp.]
MPNNRLHQRLGGGALALTVALTPIPTADACTRAVYLGPDDTIITVRSMDWKSDLGSNLWSFPRGMARDGAAGPTAIRWTSKYGSVITTAFDAATADGMNERGLVANLLYLSEADYVQPAPGDPRLPLSISAWVQYLLDNYATVAEAVAALRAEPFYVVPVASPDGVAGNVHVSISDAAGDSAVFEYIGGKLVIHHGRQYQVMTNSPIYQHQLALDAYWQQIGGTIMLPGTNRAADRFVRASFYINAIPQTTDNAEAVASAFSVIRNVSVPLGISTPGQPNISSTLWRTVADHKNRRYYFESTRTPNVFWVNLAELDFTPGTAAGKLTLTGGAIYAGNVAAQFTPQAPFEFLAVPVN